MSLTTMIELAGYLGSTLVVVSMLMSSVVKLRVINTIGSCISAAYALIIHSYPLALMNICLIVINCYNLVKLLKSEKRFDLVSANMGDSFLAYVLDYYKQDIQTVFGATEQALAASDTAYIVCSGGIPAGLLLGKTTEKGVLDIVVDYSTPTYRDCSVGTYLYSKLPEHGVRKLIYDGNVEGHEEYLVKMGFAVKDGIYEKVLG